MCYRNRISAKEFCEMYSNLCEKPRNVQEYCLKHSEFCPENKSDLVIPRHGYYTNFSNEVSQKSQQLLFNSSDSPPFSMVPWRNSTVTYVQEGFGRYLKCFSENLQLFRSDLKYIRRPVDFYVFGVTVISRYNLSLLGEEAFDSRGRPQVFFAIHPPANPINPVHQGYAIRSGFTYVVDVKLEEDRLLEHPFATNCEDYNVAPKNANEKEPRSQEICMEMCKSKFLKECAGCNGGMTMHFTTKNLCPKIREKGCPHSSLNASELNGKLQTCLMRCKPDCLKLRYPYTVVATENEGYLETGHRDMTTAIVVYVKDSDVKIMSHDPLYAKGELFSYIGGLVGCWLGISVWAFTSILVEFIQKVGALKRKWKQKKEESSADAKDV